MNKKRLLTLSLLALMIVLASCMPAGTAPEAKLRALNLNLTYIPNVQFAPFYVAIENGYFKDEGLEIKLIYGNESDMVSLVGADKEKFMIASGEQIVMARSQGLPVVDVLDWYKDYPVGVVSLKEAGIQTLQDLKGKKIGLPGLYGANYIGFEALAKHAGLSDADYQLQSIGFTQVEALVTGQIDAAVIYLANEPVQLRARGYDVDLLRVVDQVELVGNGLVTNEKTIKEETELVRAMVRAVQKGIDWAAAHPDETYQICGNYIENLKSADAAIQKEVLAESIKLWRLSTDPRSSDERWQNMQNLLLELGLIAQATDLQGAHTDAFLP